MSKKEGFLLLLKDAIMEYLLECKARRHASSLG